MMQSGLQKKEAAGSAARIGSCSAHRQLQRASAAAARIGSCSSIGMGDGDGQEHKSTRAEEREAFCGGVMVKSGSGGERDVMVRV